MPVSHAFFRSWIRSVIRITVTDARSCVGKLVGAATVMLHDAVEPVPLFSGVLKDFSPPVPDHAPVPHPPRARLVAPDNLVADIHFKAAAGVLSGSL